MNIRNIISQFTQTVANLPADQQAVLSDLAGRMSGLSDSEAAQAVELGANRGLSIRTGVRAGLDETDY